MRSLFHKSKRILFMEGIIEAERTGGFPGGAQRIQQSWGCGVRAGLGVHGAHRLCSDPAPTHHGQGFHPSIPATPGCFLDTKTECGEDANINQVSGASFPWHLAGGPPRRGAGRAWRNSTRSRHEQPGHADTDPGLVRAAIPKRDRGQQTACFLIPIGRRGSTL